MNRKVNSRVGEKSVTKEGYIITIISYTNNVNISIKFEDNTGTILDSVAYKEFKNGHIKNPNHPSICSVGFYGKGAYKAKINGKHTASYLVWRMMILRCYSEKEFLKRPTYKEVTVCEEWQNFQNFAQWFENNYIEGFELDKDILFKGNKIYSPETCCFVPSEINNLFIKSNTIRGKLPIGVRKNYKKYAMAISKYGKCFTMSNHNTPEEAFQAYKTEKEQYIKEVADKWKGLVAPKVYEALYNYQVEITD